MVPDRMTGAPGSGRKNVKRPEHSSPPGRNSHENRQVIRCGHRPRRPSVSDAPGGGCAPLRGCRLHRDFSKCLEQRLAIRGGLSPAARGSQASGIQHVPRQNHPRGASARQCRGHYRRAARRTRLRLRYTRRRHDLQYVRLCTGNHPQSHSQSGSGSHPRHHLIRHAHRQGGNRARRERRTAQDYSVVPRRNG